MALDLYLIRHPAPKIEPGVCYGQLDVELQEPDSVHRHAHRLRAMLPEVYTLYSSPLLRAHQLASALGTPTLDDRLQEMSFGSWEARPYSSIARAQIDAWAQDPLGFRPPDAETGHEVLARIMSFHRTTIAPVEDANIVVVGHQGPFRLWLASLLEIPPRHSDALCFEYAKLCHVRLQPPLRPTLRLLNG